jgi:DNA modification methylase
MIDVQVGDCLDVLKTLDDNSIDSIVTDPPYGLSFMGKRWDYDVPSVEVWRECLRVLKHGGHLLSFAGARTYHRMAVNIEDAGFEIRDQIMWVYGSGFPKSLNIGKAIDKAAGAKREVIGDNPNNRPNCVGKLTRSMAAPITVQPLTNPTTPEAKQWDGWGTALKPAHEPIVMARKPLSEKTIAKNVLRWGTGGINIDGCRVGYNGEKPSGWFNEKERTNAGFKLTAGSSSKITSSPDKGRFPANFIHDGSDEVVGLFPETKSAGYYKNPEGDCAKREGSGSTVYPSFDSANKDGRRRTARYSGDSGSAARFFYCPKANKKERNAGCGGLPKKSGGSNAKGYTQDVAKGIDRNALIENHHPTVKPLALMQYLCRLVTPTRGVVLDPFMGSGTTGIAAKAEGFGFVGIEREADYVEIAMARIVNG